MKQNLGAMTGLIRDHPHLAMEECVKVPSLQQIKIKLFADELVAEEERAVGGAPWDDECERAFRELFQVILECVSTSQLD